MTDVGSDTVGQVLGRWMTIQEAVSHLSVSERTIFRRASTGQLCRRQHTDGHTEVWMPLAEDPATSDDRHDVGTDSVGQDRMLTLVDRFGEAVSRQVTPLVAELTASRLIITDLARENGQLAERIAGLERELSAARQVTDTDRHATVSPTASNLTAQAAEPPSEPSEPPSPRVPEPQPPGPNGSRPWWRRWAVLLTG